MTTNTDTTCTRCKGTGRYTARGHLADDVCFGCTGKGYRTTEDRAASRESSDQAKGRTVAVKVIESFARTISDTKMRQQVLCFSELEEVVTAVRSGTTVRPAVQDVLDYLLGKGYDFATYVKAGA